MASSKPPGPPGPYPKEPRSWGIDWWRWPLGPDPSYMGDGSRPSGPSGSGRSPLPGPPVERPEPPGELPPPPKHPQLPLPIDPAPALPSALMSSASSEIPSLEVLERWSAKYVGKGRALNALKPLPWDDYEYPPTPQVPDEAIKAHDRDTWLTRKILDWWERAKDQGPDEERPAPPESDDGRLLPSGLKGVPLGVVRRTRELVLPGQQSLADQTREHMEATGLLGEAPLELFNQYLEAAGIRYFKADEVTKHNWFKVKSVNHKPVLKDVSAWSGYLMVVGPDHPITFVLPGHVVPDPRLWPNVVGALRVIDRFRHWLQAPVMGVSGYRLPFYNAGIGGSKDSYHMIAGSVDFAFSKRTAQGDIDASIFWRWLQALYATPGQGVGAYASFIHFDLGFARHKTSKYERWIHRDRKVYDDVFGGLSYRFVGPKK